MHIDDKMIPLFKPCLVPLALRGKSQTELYKLKEHSDCAAPTVPVLKANGEVQICDDYKVTVNVAAKYPIPNIDDLYSKLLGRVFYSKKLDLSHDQQRVLSEESKKLNTVTSLKGLFAYTRLC